jgi:hypothetical protein
MKHRFAALLLAMAAILAMHPAVAQQAKPAEAERSKLGEILKGEISPESLALAKQLVKLTNTTALSMSSSPTSLQKPRTDLSGLTPRCSWGSSMWWTA